MSDTLTDKKVKFFTAATGKSTLVDAEREYFARAGNTGIGFGQNNVDQKSTADIKRLFFNSLGYTGSLADQERQWAVAKGFNRYDDWIRGAAIAGEFADTGAGAPGSVRYQSTSGHVYRSVVPLIVDGTGTALTRVDASAHTTTFPVSSENGVLTVQAANVAAASLLRICLRFVDVANYVYINCINLNIIKRIAAVAVTTIAPGVPFVPAVGGLFDTYTLTIAGNVITAASGASNASFTFSDPAEIAVFAGVKRGGYVLQGATFNQLIKNATWTPA